MTDHSTVEVITTVRIGTESKTFSATATTTGNPAMAARNLVNTTSEDARYWTRDVQESLR